MVQGDAGRAPSFAGKKSAQKRKIGNNREHRCRKQQKLRNQLRPGQAGVQHKPACQYEANRRNHRKRVAADKFRTIGPAQAAPGQMRPDAHAKRQQDGNREQGFVVIIFPNAALKIRQMHLHAEARQQRRGQAQCGNSRAECQHDNRHCIAELARLRFFSCAYGRRQGFIPPD